MLWPAIWTRMKSTGVLVTYSLCNHLTSCVQIRPRNLCFPEQKAALQTTFHLLRQFLRRIHSLFSDHFQKCCPWLTDN